ncbi:hypothetical protein [Lysobacter sp. MMG2]|nr:hypothetical protein [Lysobacter sp. MMG2]
MRLSDDNGGQLTVSWNDEGKCALDVNASFATKSSAGIAFINNGVCHAR